LTTAIWMPFSKARNCSSFSARSSGETGNFTRRNKRFAPVTVNAQMLQKRKRRQLFAPVAASRTYGIVRREKYKARPAALTTTFTTFGFSTPPSSDGVAAVDISSRPAPRPRRQSPRINQRLVALDVDTASQAQFRATSAMRSVPLGCSGRSFPTRQKFCATSQMRVSSVATMTSPAFGLLALLHHVLNERFARDERSGLPGNRVEHNARE
jgi:hypothetical protein